MVLKLFGCCKDAGSGAVGLYYRCTKIIVLVEKCWGCVCQRAGNWMGKKSSNFHDKCILFLKLEFFKILTFASILKMKKTTWCILPLYVDCCTEDMALTCNGMSRVPCLSGLMIPGLGHAIWWLVGIVGFCNEFKYSPAGQVLRCYHRAESLENCWGASEVSLWVSKCFTGWLFLFFRHFDVGQLLYCGSQT